LKSFRILLTILAFTLILTGCGDASGDEKEKEKEEKKEDLGAVEPSKTYKEIEFTDINWIMGEPASESEPGVYIYNKEKHPSSLSDQDWDHSDMLYVQANPDKYKGKSLSISKLQVIQKDVVKIVVSLNQKSNSDGDPPETWVEIEAGALDGKKFIVETKDGERVKLK